MKLTKISAKFISNVTQIIILAAIIGVVQLISLDLEWKSLITIEFYTTVAYRTLIGFIVKNLTLNVLYDGFIKKDPTYINLLNKFKILISKKEDDFPEFINTSNKENKLSELKKKLELLKFKLEKKIHKVKSTKKIDKLEKKIAEVKEDLNNISIENIDDYNVKYEKIFNHYFTLASLSTDSNPSYTGSYNKQKIKYIVSSALNSILLLAIVTLIAKDSLSTGFTSETLFNLLTDLFIVASAFGSSCISFNRLINKSTLLPLEMRVDLLVKYVAKSRNVTYAQVNASLEQKKE